MRFGLLGALEVRDDAGAPVDVGGRQPRLLLALLLLQPRRPVSVEALTDAIWGEEPPASATGTLQSYVSRLRRVLGAHGVTLGFSESGYALDVDPEQVDAHRFERLAADAHRLVDADPERASRLASEALALWRGTALQDLADVEAARGAATRWEELRLVALEDRFAAELALGHHQLVVGELTEAARAHPFREGLHAKLGLALYRSGRQADALRAVAAASTSLREELGIEPGRELRDLERAILDHDPGLDLTAPARLVSDRAAPEAGGNRRASADRPSVPVDAETVAVSAPGREAELRELLGAWEEATGEARFVLVEGEPGIGKTHLVEQLRRVADAAGALAVWGRCDEGGAAPALWPWLTPVRAAIERAGGDETRNGLGIDAELGPLLSASTDARIELFGAREPRDLFGRIADVLARAADGERIVVLIDDLQWADVASLDLLADLALRRPAGLLVAATMRQLEVGRADRLVEVLSLLARTPGSRRLVLRGLRAEATAALLDEEVHLDPTVAAAVHLRAEGNPFYAIELARLARDEGTVPDALPATVRDVIRRRLAALPSATLDVLSVAAVCGRDVDLSLVAPAARVDPDDCLDALDPAVVHRLLVAGDDRPDVLRFSHALVREVLLEDMTPLRRARLHVRVADAMEARGVGADDAEILAEHLWQSTPAGTGRRAAFALRRAAEVALTRGAYTAAETLLRRAGELLQRSGSAQEDLPVRLAMAVRELEVSQARRAFGGIDPAVFQRVRELATLADDREALRMADWYEWSILATGNRLEEARARGTAIADELVRDPRIAVQGEAFQMRTVMHWSNGEIDQAVACADAAADLLTRAPDVEASLAQEYRRMLGRTFRLLVHALHGDDPEDISRAFDAVIATAPNRFAASTAIGFAETTAAALGRVDELIRRSAIALAMPNTEEHQFPYGHHLMSAAIAAAATDHRPPPEELHERFRVGRDRYVAVGARAGLAMFEAQLAITLLSRRDDAEAVAGAAPIVAGAREELDEWHERWCEPVVDLADAWLAAARGDAALASEHVERGHRLAVAQGAMGVARRIDEERDLISERAEQRAAGRGPTRA